MSEDNDQVCKFITLEGSTFQISKETLKLHSFDVGSVLEEPVKLDGRDAFWTMFIEYIARCDELNHERKANYDKYMADLAKAQLATDTTLDTTDTTLSATALAATNALTTATTTVATTTTDQTVPVLTAVTTTATTTTTTTLADPPVATEKKVVKEKKKYARKKTLDEIKKNTRDYKFDLLTIEKNDKIITRLTLECILKNVTKQYDKVFLSYATHAKLLTFYLSDVNTQRAALSGLIQDISTAHRYKLKVIKQVLLIVLSRILISFDTDELRLITSG